MTNSEVIKNLSVRLGQPQAEIKRLLSGSMTIIKKILDKNIRITVPGLGTFRVYIRQKRKSFDPYHKKHIMLPLKRTIAFRPGSSIKNELKFKRIENE